MKDDHDVKRGYLRGVVKMWPTPTAVTKEEEYEVWLSRMQRKTDPKSNTKTKPSDLGIAVKMWPTPAATDHKGSGKTGELRDRLDYAVERGATKTKVYDTPQAAGSLNPTWVEWLMGFPTGWTDLNALETPSSRKSSRKLDGQSLKDTDK